LIERSEFEQELAKAEQRPEDIDRFSLYHFGYIEDVLEALQWTDYIEDEDNPVGEDIFATGHWRPMEPVRNPMRHVGRNDPCPCGSGKKAKKCCLARQD
jgi:preprotein translocase subunit SecA